jgi:hypothetical protein
MAIAQRTNSYPTYNTTIPPSKMATDTTVLQMNKAATSCAKKIN